VEWGLDGSGQNTYLCIVNNGSNYEFLKSTDGFTWTRHTQTLNTDGSNFAPRFKAGGGQWVMGLEHVQGVTAAPLIATSPDGVTWTARSTPADSLSQAVLQLAFNGYIWVAALAPFGPGVGFAMVMTSTDAVTWHPQDTPMNGAYITGIAYSSSGGWVVVASDAFGTSANNVRMMTSPDDTTWTAATPFSPSGQADIWYGVTYDAKSQRFTAMGGIPGGSGQPEMICATSAGGTSWTAHYIPPPNPPNGYVLPNWINANHVEGGIAGS
jgi:hypothetical protein